MTTDLGILIYDLSQLLKHIKMSKQDKKILKMWRQDALTQFDIAKGLNITQQHVASTLNKIAIRVVNVFEVKYEDWYYLNLVKGRYKKCSCCGGIKLANERYFRGIYIIYCFIINIFYCLLLYCLYRYLIFFIILI